MSVYLYLPIRKHFITLAIKSNDNVVPYLLSSPGEIKGFAIVLNGVKTPESLWIRLKCDVN